MNLQDNYYGATLSMYNCDKSRQKGPVDNVAISIQSALGVKLSADEWTIPYFTKKRTV